jgi:hypothetical protein
MENRHELAGRYPEEKILMRSRLCDARLGVRIRPMVRRRHGILHLGIRILVNTGQNTLRAESQCFTMTPPTNGTNPTALIIERIYSRGAAREAI